MNLRLVFSQSSQRNMLNSLLRYNNLSEGSKLVITTHSPYIINCLTLGIKAKMVLDNPKVTDDFRHKVELIVPSGSRLGYCHL